MDFVMSLLSLAMAMLVLTPKRADAIAFPNEVQGDPVVDCFVDRIKLSVETTQGNPSHMFVKSRHHEANCVSRNTNSIEIGHENCGLKRERSLSPPGISYKICVVVQLHPQFVTKVDKTFCASCFYMEAVKELSNELGISPLSSTEIAISSAMPNCAYSIRRGAPTGPEIKFAVVGEPVYHVWDCPSDTNGMLVQNCYVDDSQGNRILIVDQNGCGVDRYIMQTPEYNDEITMAFQESHVFKFADKTITRFTCQIKVCMKSGQGCDGISPPQDCPDLGAGGGASAVNFKQPAFRSGSNVRFNRFNDAGRFSFNNRYARAVDPKDLGKASNMGEKAESVEGSGEDEIDEIGLLQPKALTEDFEDDVMDVSGELFILDNLLGGDTDWTAYEEVLNSIASGKFVKKAMKEQASRSVCIPTVGFAMILILFSILIVVTIVVTSALILKGKAKTKKSYAAFPSSDTGNVYRK